MDKKIARIRRATRARRKIAELGATRLVVHRTPRHVYAQVIAANGSEVIAAASTVEKAIREQVKGTGNKDAAAVVGKLIAQRALKKALNLLLLTVPVSNTTAAWLHWQKLPVKLV